MVPDLFGSACVQRPSILSAIICFYGDNLIWQCTENKFGEKRKKKGGGGGGGEEETGGGER